MSQTATVFCGTRPEVVKLVPVVLALRERGITTRFVSSGQHGPLAEHALSAFDVAFDDKLADYEPQGLHAMTARMLEAGGKYLEENPTDWVVVQGDTATTFALAVAAFLSGVKVAHVEAGLRTGDKMSPWPEEAFRSMVSEVASLNFCPTEEAKCNLEREGITDNVHVTGNTIVDGLRLCSPKAIVPDWAKGANALAVITCHRRENRGMPAKTLAKVTASLAQDGVHCMVACHPAPEASEPFQGLEGTPRVKLCGPLPYVEMIGLMSAACVVITDSGGLTEEGAALGVPVVIYRKSTERMEAVRAGCARMGWDFHDAYEAAMEAVDEIWQPSPSDVFGDGRAAHKIAELMEAE